MAARVLLLMSLTGLFAAAWNSDCPEAATLNQTAATHLLEFKTIAGDHVQKLKVSKVSQAQTISKGLELSDVLLPELIATGTYRVVDDQGQVGWITIAPRDQSTTTPEDAESFYVSQSNTGRWYFIRVDAAPLIAVPETSETALR